MRRARPLSLNTRDIAAALHTACLVELAALKPGNVHRYAPGHGMSVADFERSAGAIAPVFEQSGLTVGVRIVRAVEATQTAVGCNTNLGIILLAAPLAEAAAGKHEGELRPRLGRILDLLTVADAEQAFRAIRLANPAGLGRSDRHDVGERARVTLKAAMAEAAPHDLIARQYATGYEDVFETSLPLLREALANWGDENWAAASVYLHFLTALPDSHIVRKFGMETAEEVRRSAAAPNARLRAAEDPESMRAVLLELDAALKAEDLNPGTSADLTVATLFAQRLEDLLAGRVP